MKLTKKALISVWDKTGVVEIGDFLVKNNFDIISTGGTEIILKENGIPVTPVEELTNFSEIMNGRVKTLHPKIFGGILVDKSNESHMADLESINGYPFDVVIVNLYPFKEKAIDGNLDDKNAIEFIDIGGPSMLRAAAKNFNSITVLSNPTQYDDFISNYNSDKDECSLETRKRFALEVFKMTSSYDQMIYSYLSQSKEDSFMPKNISINVSIMEELRYGENPHQKAGFYSNEGKFLWDQHQGKKLSYNNYADIETAYNIVNEFDDNACCIIKHANPCGFSKAKTSLLSYKKAVESDPTSYFGGIVGFNKEIDQDVAIELNKSFLECIIAPKISEEALEIFKTKKNLRVISAKKNITKDLYSLKSVAGGYLLQEKDFLVENFKDVKVVTNKKPSDDQLKLFSIGMRLIKYVKSNAIILINNDQLIGLGAGQTSRIDSVKLAIDKALENNFDLNGSILASDAFFPFTDGLEFAFKSGIDAIVQPGGSINDSKIIDFANKQNMIMCFTGIRHFYH